MGYVKRIFTHRSIANMIFCYCYVYSSACNGRKISQTREIISLTISLNLSFHCERFHSRYNVLRIPSYLFQNFYLFFIFSGVLERNFHRMYVCCCYYYNPNHPTSHGTILTIHGNNSYFYYPD